jgi:sigma-B regulation protein RsbU (phosphoserine phosphatase)
MNYSGRKILLIDDDRIVRESIAAYLEDSGFSVIETDDGQKGFELFLDAKPDLVISDLRMPKIDGLSLLRKISERQTDIPAPIIVISGAGGMNDVVEALRTGACDYIVKPIVDMKVLEHSIQHCLDRFDLQRQNQLYKQQLEAANLELKESLKLLEQDQKAGLQLQLKMFPQEPLQVRDYRVTYKLIPSLFLSGDFLEYSEYDNAHLGFYLADVSGHGSSSAFVTALLHHLSVRLVRRHEKNRRTQEYPMGTPAEILAYFNRELLSVGIDKYVTMFLGIINTDTGEMHYSVAGHLPMPILATANDAHYLEGTGMPLGIIPDVDYYDYTVQLPDAFSLCIFSDGILEILPADGLLKQEDYLLNLIRNGAHNIEQISTTLALDALKDVPDDIAIMTVQRYPDK